MAKQSYKVLAPFPHEGEMKEAGTVSLSAREASHLLAGGKIALSVSKGVARAKSRAQSKAQTKAKSNKGK